MNAYIIDGIRTPIGKFRGMLSSIRTDDLGAIPIKNLIERNRDVNFEEVDDVIYGCANQAGEDNRNVARMSSLLAGLPWSVPGETVNRLCSSGMSSVIHAYRAIKSGEGDLFISGGVENMTRGPMVMSKSDIRFGRNPELHDSSFGWRFVNPKMHKMYGTDGMGTTAENLAEKYKISREDQDKFACWSQMKATKANQNGRLAKEITPVTIPQRKGSNIVFSKDEFIKPNTSIEVLSTLRTVFKKENGTVTAGNASGLNDGAAALLVASESKISSLGLKPMTRIVSSGVVGVEPKYMGIGPVGASNLALKRAGLKFGDMDIIEINEAFAAQVLACTREMGLRDDDERINPNGGSIALGHPLGVTGSRLLLTASHELVERKLKYALVTLCVGVGQGYATILERV